MYPTPYGMHRHRSTSWFLNFGNVAAGKGYDYVPTSPNYPRGGRSEMDQDPEGQSRGMAWPTFKQSLAILQVWRHCLLGRENCFKQSDKLAGHVDEGVHHYVGL